MTISSLVRPCFTVITLVYAVIMKITALSFMYIARKWLIRDDREAVRTASRPGGTAEEGA